MVIKEYEVCLSAQKALVEKVTQKLRRICFILKENLIIFYFFYDGEPSEFEEELVGDFAAEVIADFPASYKIDCKIIGLKYPEKISSMGRIIFSRYE